MDSVSLYGLSKGYHYRALALGEQIQQPDALGQACIGLAAHWTCLGEWDKQAECSQRAVEIYQKTGDLHFWGFAAFQLCCRLIWQGDYAQVLAHGQSMVQLGRDGNDPQVECWGWMHQGWALERSGQFGEAIPVLRKAIELAQGIPDYFAHAVAGGELGRCYLHQGELERALSTLHAAQEVCVGHNIGWGASIAPCTGLAEAYLLAVEQGDKAERAGWLKKARRASKNALKQGKMYRFGLPLAMMLRGRCEWLRGKPEIARKWWQRSLAMAEEMGQRHDLGTTHLEMGRRLGDHAYLKRAEAILAEIGAKWDLARAREALMEAQAI